VDSRYYVESVPIYADGGYNEGYGTDGTTDYYLKKARNKFIHLSGSVFELIIIAYDGPTAKYIQEYEAKLADEFVETETGITYMRNTTVTDELIRWILQFGSGARVLNPAHLRDKIKKELINSLKQYLSIIYQRKSCL